MLAKLEASVEDLQRMHLLQCADAALDEGRPWLAGGYRAMAEGGLWPVRYERDDRKGWQWWRFKPDWLLGCRLEEKWYQALRERAAVDRMTTPTFPTLQEALRTAAMAWGDWQCRTRGLGAELSRVNEELRLRGLPVQERLAFESPFHGETTDFRPK